MTVLVVILCVLVLLIAVGLVMVFAMLGELSSRVSNPDATEDLGRHIAPIDARVGSAITDWPASLDLPRSCVLIVFSTICESCRALAGELRDGASIPTDSPVGVVVSTGDRAAGERFVEEFGLAQQRPVFVDVGGAWVKTNFDIAQSPAVLVLADGRLQFAYGFDRLAALGRIQTKFEQPVEGG